MNDFQEELHAGLAALRQVLDGVAGLVRAANLATRRLGGVVGHATDGELLRRVLVAGVRAAAKAAEEEIQTAIMRSPAAPSPDAESMLTCNRHGAQPWVGTMICRECGEVFQLLGLDAPHLLNDRCRCGARLLVSASPICSGCVAETVAPP